MIRHYLFELDEEGGTVLGNVDIRLDGTPDPRPDIEDMRIIISLCCSLILRYGEYVDQDVLERVKRIQLETGLGERLH